MSRSATALARYRRHRPLGTALFILLLFVVSTERRLADAHFNLRWLSDAVAVDSVTEGSVVKVVYEEKDGKPVAMMIEIK